MNTWVFFNRARVSTGLRTLISIFIGNFLKLNEEQEIPVTIPEAS